MIHEILLSHNALRHAYQAGMLPQSEFEKLQHNWLSLMRTTGGRQWWRGWKHMTPADVVEYVDTALDDPDIDVRPLDQEVPWLFALDDDAASRTRGG